MPTNYKKLFAIRNKNKAKIKSIAPNIEDRSGIYILTREEAGFKYGYVGQATVSVWERLAEHLSGYQHIDLSIKNHGWFSEENPSGYKISFFYAPKEKLNELEQEYIKRCANAGYQLRNKTAGSQSKGKFGISDNRPSKGYRDGIAHGEKKTIELVKTFFDKYLDYSIKQPPNKIKERKLEEFNDLLNGKTED